MRIDYLLNYIVARKQQWPVDTFLFKALTETR